MSPIDRPSVRACRLRRLQIHAVSESTSRSSKCRRNRITELRLASSYPSLNSADATTLTPIDASPRLERNSAARPGTRRLTSRSRSMRNVVSAITIRSEDCVAREVPSELRRVGQVLHRVETRGSRHRREACQRLRSRWLIQGMHLQAEGPLAKTTQMVGFFWIAVLHMPEGLG